MSSCTLKPAKTTASNSLPNASRLRSGEIEPRAFLSAVLPLGTGRAVAVAKEALERKYGVVLWEKILDYENQTILDKLLTGIASAWMKNKGIADAGDRAFPSTGRPDGDSDKTPAADAQSSTSPTGPDELSEPPVAPTNQTPLIQPPEGTETAGVASPAGPVVPNKKLSRTAVLATLLSKVRICPPDNLSQEAKSPDSFNIFVIIRKRPAQPHSERLPRRLASTVASHPQQLVTR